jgi:hypothetical protein
MTRAPASRSLKNFRYSVLPSKATGQFSLCVEALSNNAIKSVCATRHNNIDSLLLYELISAWYNRFYILIRSVLCVMNQSFVR